MLSLFYNPSGKQTHPSAHTVKKALDLSPEERAVAHELILSLDDVGAKEVKKAWVMEIDRRVKEIKSGKAKGRLAVDILVVYRFNKM